MDDPNFIPSKVGKIKGDHLANTPQLTAPWLGIRKKLEIGMDEGRVERTKEIAERYGRMLGRRCSTSLVICRAIDLLADHLDTLEAQGADARLVEQLTMLSVTRQPIPVATAATLDDLGLDQEADDPPWFNKDLEDDDDD